MWFWATGSTRSTPVAGGKRERARCCDCERETTFVEVEVVDKMSIFSVFTVDEDTSSAFRCIECGALGQLVDTDEAPARRRNAVDAGYGGELEDLGQGQLERQRADRAAQRAAREASADRELAALKQRMGLGPARQLPPTSSGTRPVQRAASEPPEAPPPSWWRRMRGKR